MPFADFREWWAFYERNPFGLVRDDLRCGIIASTCAAPHTKNRVKVSDFMPRFNRPRKRQTVEEQQAIFEAYYRAVTSGQGQK